MRLIDADKLYFDCTTIWGYPTVGKSQIENAPTISAVPIPEGATNGDVLKALFPKKEWLQVMAVCERDKDIKGWWNAPYKTESEPQESEEV